MLYMVTWIPSIYPSHVSIYTSTMDPSWVLIAWAYCSQFAFGGCASASPLRYRCKPGMVCSECHRTVIVRHRCPLAQEPTDGFRDWHASTALPIIACPQQSQPCSARHLAAWAKKCAATMPPAGLASSKEWDKLTTNAFSTTLNKTISINFFKKTKNCDLWALLCWSVLFWCRALFILCILQGKPAK